MGVSLASHGSGGRLFWGPGLPHRRSFHPHVALPSGGRSERGVLLLPLSWEPEVLARPRGLSAQGSNGSEMWEGGCAVPT